MKKPKILLFVCAGILLAACARENQPETPAQGEITIRLTVPGMLTRTTDPAGTVAERTITSLEYLVYDDVTAAPVWTGHDDIASGDQVDGDYERHIAPETLLGSDPDESVLLNMTVYVVANWPSSSTPLEGTTLTLAQVKALAVDADAFVTEGVVAENPRFIMVAEGHFDKEGLDSAVADLTLSRLAAKVSLTLAYAQEITTPGEDFHDFPTEVAWMPMSGENVRVYLDNSAMSATLGGPASPVPAGFTYADAHPSASSTVDFYSYPFAWGEGDDRAPFIKIIQPWLYVRSYKDGDKDVIVEENQVEFYYKVMFPGLTSLESNKWYNTTVTLDVLGGEAESPVELDVTGLDVLGWGTATGIDPVDLQPVKYLSVEEPTVRAENGNPVSVRFIASSRPNFTVDLVDKWVYTNDDSTQVVIGPTVNMNITDHYGYEYENSTYSPSDWVTLEYNSATHEGFVHVKHTLSGDLAATNFAARPYVYKISLDLDNLHEDLTVRQYPPLYVEGQMSTGWVCINGVDAANSSKTAGYYSKTSVSYVNGYQPRTETDGAWSNSDSNYFTYVRLADDKPATGNGGHNAFIYLSWEYAYNTIEENAVNTLGTIHTYNFLNPNGGNSSRWRIIMRPTATADEYIMDPRINASDDSDLNNIINKHVQIYNGSSSSDGSPLLPHGSSSSEYNKIKAYKPSGKIDKYREYIGPEIMFASSYGKSTSINYYDSILRCAAYQEDGFPAGRWRVPTELEIETAIKLAARGAIPTLFNTAGRYWASSGKYYYYDNGQWKWKDNPTNAEMTFTVGNSSYSLGVRCVYDTWYWGKEEVTALMTDDNGKKPGCTSDTRQPQYTWSGYSYTSK